MNGPEYVETLVSQVPEASPTVREHLEDNDGALLLHPLIADLRRLATTWFGDDSSDALQRLLAVLEAALSDGDEHVENAVAVSFVEDSAWWDPASQAFIATWPTGLAHEVERQRNSQS